MVELNEMVIDDAVHKGSSLVTEDLVSLAEWAHDGGPGVPREALAAYAERLADDPEMAFDAEEFLASVDDRLTDDDEWQGVEPFYAVGDDRISRYPARWHRELGGSTDVGAFVAFLQREVPEYRRDVGQGGAGHGLPEQPLLDVVASVGDLDRREAKAALEDARERGTLVEDADQHPNAGVYLRDGADELRDKDLDR